MNYYLDLFRKYADFEGRASRAEFWTGALVSFFIEIGFVFLEHRLGLYSDEYRIGLFSFVYGGVAFVPSLAVIVRRLHDANLNGLLILVALFPIVGWIALLILLLLPGQSRMNRYGLVVKKKVASEYDQARSEVAHRKMLREKRLAAKLPIPEPIPLSLENSMAAELHNSVVFYCTRFALNDPTLKSQSGASLLTSFLRDPASDRSFLADDGLGTDTGSHGPFRRADAVPDWFEPMTTVELFRRALGILDGPVLGAGLTPEQRKPVEAWLQSVVSSGDEVFELSVHDAPGRSQWALYREFLCIRSDHSAILVAVFCREAERFPELASASQR
ncbi:MAG: DUF805 domain-containing protein [Candidatus Brocadiia bacterium]